MKLFDWLFKNHPIRFHIFTENEYGNLLKCSFSTLICLLIVIVLLIINFLR